MILNDLTVAIIAGGKSSRFGEPKSWATFNGKSMIDYAISLSMQLSDKVIIINGKTLDYSPLGILTIEDEILNCGPIGGLYTALKNATTEKILIMPVDMPFLNKTIYLELLKHQNGNKPVISSSHNGLEPLVSVWSKNNLSVIGEFIQKNQFSLRKPIKALNSIVVNLPGKMENYPAQCFVNINYKEDLSSLNHIALAG